MGARADRRSTWNVKSVDERSQVFPSGTRVMLVSISPSPGLSAPDPRPSGRVLTKWRQSWWRRIWTNMSFTCILWTPAFLGANNFGVRTCHCRQQWQRVRVRLQDSVLQLVRLHQIGNCEDHRYIGWTCHGQVTSKKCCHVTRRRANL